MINKPYVVSDNVLDQFVKFHKSSIEKIIVNKLYQKQENVINCHRNQIFFTFYEDRFLVYIIDQEFLVTDLICYNYDQLITKEFLNQFYFISNILPPRLKQWVNDEHFSMLKNEIIEALTCNKITFYCDLSNRVIFEWKAYDIKFELSKDFTFSNIL